MHLPPLSRGQKSRASRAGAESVILIDDATLLAMFRTRRRRMEVASNIARSMVKRINVLSETLFDGGVTGMLLEDVNTTVETSGGNDADKTAAADDPVVSLGAGPFSLSLETALEHETIQKLRTLTVMRAEQRRAAESNTKPHFQLKESALETPQPPAKFSSTSLTFVLEIISQSARKILEATDSVMLKLSMLIRKATSPIVDEVKIVSVHSQHLCRCYTAALYHLRQYEACEKCLNKATAYELGNAREQLIEQKEVLTAQEKRQKVAEDQLQALKVRLASLEAQCRLWSAFLHDKQNPHLAGASPLSVCTDAGSAFVSRATSLRVPHMSSQSCEGLVRSPSGLRRVSSGYQMSLHTLRPHTPLVGGSIVSSPPSSLEDLNPCVDSVELRVAQFWCNPYLLKAKQCRGWRQSSNQVVADSPPLAECIFQASISRSHATSRIDSSTVFVESCRMSRADVHTTINTELSETNTADVRLTVLLRGLLRGIVRLNRRSINGDPPPQQGMEGYDDAPPKDYQTRRGNDLERDAVTEGGGCGEENNKWRDPRGGPSPSDEGSTVICERSAGAEGTVSLATSTSDQSAAVENAEGIGETDVLLTSIRKLISFLESKTSALS